MTVGPNLAGLPHISLPVGFDNKMPIGMMIIGDHLAEGKIIQIASQAEKNVQEIKEYNMRKIIK